MTLWRTGAPRLVSEGSFQRATPLLYAGVVALLRLSCCVEIVETIVLYPDQRCSPSVPLRKAPL